MGSFAGSKAGSKAGWVCLQGGAEFTSGCRRMDAALLAKLQGGSVVVTALAGAAGREYATACANGVRYFRSLGASNCTAAPDAREDPDGAVAALRQAALVVLPGGSPARLAAALADTPVGGLLPSLVDAGVCVLGSSAGAMLLCAWTVVPERRHGSWPLVQPGLGVVPRAAVVPHWSGDRADWLDALRAAAIGVEILAVPECAGLLVEDGTATAVGAAGTTVIDTIGRREVPVGGSWKREP